MSNKFVKFLITAKGKEIERFAFAKGQSSSVKIGKARDKNDIAVNVPYISGNHLIISYDGDKTISVKDLESTNGTFVNNNRIESSTNIEVQIGDIIAFMDSSEVQLLILAPDAVTEKPKANQALPKKDMSKLADKINANSEITVGRSDNADIQLKSDVISRAHAYIKKIGENKFSIRDNNSLNGTFVNGRPISDTLEISGDDSIKIAKFEFKINDYIADAAGIEQKFSVEGTNLSDFLKKKQTIIIGRGKECDITINDNLVSRNHAKITAENGGYFVNDLGSTNGTFVNGKKVKGKIKLSEKDELRIGLRVFGLNEAEKDLGDITAIRAVNVSKTYDNGYVGLKSMSVNIPSRGFIALMGPSGCGKTTLMNTFNGANPATGGSVFIHGLELKSNYSLLKRKIGYVPQDDIVHADLSVNKSLYFAAKLRMNDDTTEEEIKDRIDEVCKSLNIDDKKLRENKIKELSGGQRKRVSIAVELLNRPSILFLDEPTSPLDPETIDGFLKSIKNLTVTQDTTVIMVTHKPEDLNYVDRVIFLGTKGYQGYYGSEKNLYKHFDLEDKNIIGVYSLLSTEKASKTWNDKWNATQSEAPASIKENKEPIKDDQKESLLRQFMWLTRRYGKIKLSDTANLILLIAQPVVIAGLLVFIFDKLQLSILFLIAISAVWFGVSNAAKEIVSEIPIYKRERMFNLNIFTYLFSKITVLSVIALIQVFLFVLIVQLKFMSDDIPPVNIDQYLLFMFYLAFSATLLGLLLSAVFENTEKVMTVVPIILMPQIMLAGVLTGIDSRFKEILSYLTLGRWGTEGFARIQNDSPDFVKHVNDTLLIKSADRFDSIPIIDKITNPVIQTAKYKFDVQAAYDTIYTTDTITESVYNTIPVFETASDTSYFNTEFPFDREPYTYSSGTQFEGGDPLEILNFYDPKHDLFGWFDSFNSNILAISIINVVVFVGIYVALKRKDSI